MVLTLHCGAKFVQCETERCLLVAAGRLVTDSQSEAEQRGSCHVSNRKRVPCKLQAVRRNIKRRKEIFTYFAPCFLSIVPLCISCGCSHVVPKNAKRTALFFPKRSVAYAPMASAIAKQP